MTQELYVANAEGAVLVSDSLVVRELEDGRREWHSMRKLFALGRGAAIVSGGAAVGIQLSRELAAATRSRAPQEIEALLDLAPAFLNRRYQEYLLPRREWFAAHPEAPQRLYFLIAGWSERRSAPLALLLGSERVGMALQPLPAGAVVAMPRRLMLEVQLAQLAGRSTLKELADYCMAQLARLAAREPENVGGPFDGVIIRAAGMRPIIAGLPGSALRR